MKLLACSVFDNAVGSFGRPFFVQTKGVAMRSFMDEVNRPADPGGQNMVASHPDDFALYAVGTFDEDSGAFVSYSVPERICTALEVKEVK